MSDLFYASSPDDLLTPAEMLSMPGIDFLRGILEGRYPAPPISKTLNYRLHAVEDGRVVFRGTPTFDAFNPLGTTHGGWYATILDSCVACAVQSRLPKGAGYTTLELKVNIIKSIPLGMEVDAIGICQHAGRSTGVASGEIRGVADGRLYATASTTCIVLNGPRPAG